MGIKNLPKLRRGRVPMIRLPRKRYFMDIPAHVAEVKRFKWFTRLWHQKRRKSPISMPAGQVTLDRWMPINKKLPAAIFKPVVPRFRKPRVVLREEFCSDITNLAWGALRRHHDPGVAAFYLFYMNDFSALDSPDILNSPEWRKIGKYLPSDIIKYELGRLLLGFSTFTDYLRMVDLFPGFEDHLAITMNRPPFGGRLVQALRLVGGKRVRKFFNSLVAECRALGIITDKVWLWDGQFVKAWMYKERKKGSRNKTKSWGGWYNHGGKKIGFGAIQSVIMDWSGTVPLPIEVRKYPANRNDNMVFRDTFKHCIKGCEKPALFLAADKGPSGRKSLELVRSHDMVPVMALGKNRKQDVMMTGVKEYKFNKSLTKRIDPAVLEKIYMMRTRIEEMFSAVKVIFKMTRLHATGAEFIEVELLLVNILILLIALTAYKIGRPDLMWKPKAFDNLRVHPEMAFPDRIKELRKLQQ